MLIPILLLALLFLSFFATKADAQTSLYDDVPALASGTSKNVALAVTNGVLPANDGKTYLYMFNDTATATPDGVNIIQITGRAIGRWMRLKTGWETVQGLSDSMATRMRTTAFAGLFTAALTSGAMNTAYGATPLFSVPAQSWTSITGKPTIPTDNNQLTNGNNYISLTSLSAGSGITYNNTTGVITNSGSGGTVTNVGVTSTDLSISGSPVTTSGNITANLTTTGVSAGTYDAVTVDSKGRVTAGFNWTVPAAIAARSFNTAYRESTTNRYRVSVSPQVSANLTLLAGQSGTITFQMSPNGSTGWVSLGVISGSNTGSLSIGINTTQITGAPMSYDLPAGYYYQLVTTNISNTPTYTFNLGSYSILQ